VNLRQSAHKKKGFFLKVLIASGGSGGHIFPALAFANEFTDKNAEIIFVASRRRLDKSLLARMPYKKVFLSANPMPYKFGFRSFVFLGKLALDSLRSAWLLLWVRPDIVVGFGGYTGGAAVLIARLFGIKTLIHEQNLVPGRTNKFLDRYVDKIATSFYDTKNYFNNKNVVFTGNPLRAESLVNCKSRALENFKLDPGKTTILVMGGSQGAASLNELVVGAAKLLSPEVKENIQFIHITGIKGFEKIKTLYEESAINGRVVGFIKDIAAAYSACDIAITRAGAAALFELAAFGKPMILMPYPYNKNNQRFNADYFAKNRAAICVDEKKSSAGELKKIILDLINNPDKQKMLSQNVSKLSVVNGASALARLVSRGFSSKGKA